MSGASLRGVKKKTLKEKEVMVQGRPKKRPFFLYAEDEMQKAIHAVRSGGMSVNKAAKTFNVPRATLGRKIKGAVPEGRLMGPGTVLTTEEETLLERWLLGLCRKGFPVLKQMLLLSVKKTLDLSGRQSLFKDNMPGETWFKAFLRRHPNVSLKYAESLTKARAAVTKEGILRWFQEVDNYLQEENLAEINKSADRIFNADESGFQLCPKTGKILGPRKKEDVYYMVPNNEKEQITVMGCFCANGETLPPMIIFPYKRLPKEVADSVPDEWAIGLSESGWINSEVFFEYLSNHFNNYLDERNIQRPVILYVDGHRSHLSPEVSTFCSENGIILIALHPNSTHLLQPADVSVFRPLKAGWAATTRKWRVENYPQEVTRKTFAPLLKNVFDEKATPEIVKNGFKATGIFPFDPQNINFDKCLKNREVEDPFSKTCEMPIATRRNELESGKFLAMLESKISSELLEKFKTVPDGDEWSGEEQATALFHVWRTSRIENVVNHMRSEGMVNSPTPSTEGTNLRNPAQSGSDPATLQIPSPTPNNGPNLILVEVPSCSNEEASKLPVTVQEDTTQTPSTSSGKYGPKKPGSLISPFKKCLFWPKTPEKITNKRARVVFPAVVSSSKWKEFYNKTEEEKNKKKRKVKSSVIESEEDWTCKKCKSSFNEEKKRKKSRKWVECDTCKNTYHFKCVPKNHIESFGLSESDDEEDVTFMCHECAKYQESDDDFRLLDDEEIEEDRPT